ncbi:MAG: HK97 family phage prohead protease [Actinomycetes bacterium]
MSTKERYTTLSAPVENFNETSGTLSGRAVAYDTKVDRGWCTMSIAPGAFAKQIAADPGRIKILWQHDTYEPIGKVTELTDTSAHLSISAKLSESPAIPAALRTLALLREGLIDELSIGFDWVKWEESTNKDGTVHLRHTQARLREISVVTFGAMGQKARVQTVNSGVSGRQTLSDQLEIVRTRIAVFTH